MTESIKSQREILDKLQIEKLNPMQHQAFRVIRSAAEIILLSPTGTGKTLGFLLPLIELLDPEKDSVQALILVPSRELAMQIEQVAREMGTGYKMNAAYGGRSIRKDKTELKHPPAILVGTPGRIADHIRRGTIDPSSIQFLVLDEFDKSLEVGFTDEMKEILEALPNLQKKILTSATKALFIPPFVNLQKPEYIDFLDEGVSDLQIRLIISPQKDKLSTLVEALRHLGNQPGIVFCNFKDSIQRVSDFLTQNNIPHRCFYGGMEQIDREQALVKFRNGTHQLLIATDLAARGIDVPEIRFIIHYHLPLKSEEFTHRNGRTARMHQDGTAYVLKWENEELPDFIPEAEIEQLEARELPRPSLWQTLMISGGRRDKISKGDIAGLFFKIGKLNSDELGMIELKPSYAYVGVKTTRMQELLSKVDNYKLKQKKVRVRVI